MKWLDKDLSKDGKVLLKMQELLDKCSVHSPSTVSTSLSISGMNEKSRQGMKGCERKRSTMVTLEFPLWIESRYKESFLGESFEYFYLRCFCTGYLSLFSQ